MPFTFSHPAIVLPLTTIRWLSLTGLVIGSIVPDFEYFLRMKVLSTFSHTLPGLFYFDLPLGVALTYIFHLIVRNQLIEQLPSSLRSRFFNYKEFKWATYFRRKWCFVVLSVLIGASSHILWDGFTHDNGYFVKHFPVLLSPIKFLGVTISTHKIIQHLSTIIGGGVIAYSIFKMPIGQIPLARHPSSYWTWFVLITVCLVALRFVNGITHSHLGDFVVSGMAAAMIAFTVTPILLARTKVETSPKD